MINTSNHAAKDNPHWPSAQVPQPGPPPEVVGDRRSAGPRIRDALALATGVALGWLAYFVRRWGDRWFALNDTEAYRWGWQITKARGGLARRYRDIRFDTLAACTRCAGAGVSADTACGRCLGTGRVTLGEAS